MDSFAKHTIKELFNSSKLIVLFLLIISINYTANSQTEPTTKFLIRGTVTHNKLPLSDVHIIIKNTDVGAKTDVYGNYSLNVLKDDILQFSHIGYSTISIKIKGDKKIINIEMIPDAYVLEETLLKKVKRKSQNLREEDKQFSSSKENIDPRSAGYRISYIKGDDISSYLSLTSALLSRFPSYSVKSRSEGVQLGFIRNQPVLWDVDGRVTEIEPDLIMSNIEDIRVLGPSAAVNYGKRCYGLEGVGSIRSCGGVIVIRMKKGTEDRRTAEDKNRINNILGSLRSTNQTEKYNSLYSETLRNIGDTNEAYTFCEKVLTRKKSEYHQDLRLMNAFLQNYNNVDLFKNLSDLFIIKHRKNSNALKALAYELQTLQLNDASLKVYKNIFNQGEKNAPSYRNLANAFIENNEFKNALKLYLNYLKVSSEFSKNHIDKLIDNEITWLYYNNKSDFSSQDKFVPNSKSKAAFSKDIRFVLEWDNPKASFNVTFDNYKNGVTIYEHNTNDSIKEESFLIEEFLISQLGEEDWRIDLTYFGNEKNSTYLKTTCYYNWGRENQYSEIKTFLLNGDYQKVQLFKLSSTSLKRE